MARTLRSDKLLFVATMILVAVSLIMVYSASAKQSTDTYHISYYFLERQAIWLLIGLPLMLIASRIDYHEYRRPEIIWSLLAVTVVLLLATFVSETKNNVQRWIRFNGFSMQPSELAKLAAVLFTAALLERRMHRVNEINALVPIVVVAVGLAGLIVIEPDFGTSVMLVVAVCTVVFTAGLSVRHVMTAGAILVPTALALIFVADYRTRRLLSFLYPFQQDPTGDGFQLRQSLIAVGSGGTFGKGLMEGVQKVYYIPEPHNDFIYAIIGEELGLAGSTLILACFVVITWRGLRAALLAPDKFGALLAVGLTSIVSLQGLVNMSVILGLLPTKGIPLPFVSAGGSSLVVSLLAMGILLNISQQASVRAVSAAPVAEMSHA